MRATFRFRDWRLTDKRGFTLLEVLVGLAIVGLSLGVLLNLIAGSLRLATRTELASKKLTLAESKAEEAMLGLLGDKYTKKGKDKVWQGSTDRNIAWKVREHVFTGDRDKEQTVTLALSYNVSVEGIDISSVRPYIKSHKMTPED